MTSTPVIGITVYTRENVSPFVRMPYATVNVGLSDLAEEAGAVPLLLSPTTHVDDVLDRIDALVLQGGGDVHPEYYGQELHPETNTLDRRRDEFELALLARARERDLPVLGICRGIQLVNVGYGGTLVQHLADVTGVDHEQTGTWDALAHSITVASDSRLALVLDATTLEVNSVHHQAVDRLGAGLRAVAWASDGVVEAIEHEKDSVLAVQWHPEWTGSVDWERQRRLFEALVDQV
jgi:gamma-glutamyl-gamma-aminobutyrate hydrolase PuuD